MKHTIFASLLCSSLFFTCRILAQGPYLAAWPAGYDPKAVGKLAAEHFAAGGHTNFSSPTPPRSITYPEACAWYGALKFAKCSKDGVLQRELRDRFTPLFSSEQALLPPPVHVDNTVFGVIPLELYQQTRDPKYLDLGQSYANRQWKLPSDPKPEQQAWMDKGYSWQTRMWIDDMFMITMIQAQAYRATGNRVYIDRAAAEMRLYLDSLQQPNGLFYHAPDVPFFWGRGNGWMAAGMAELLRSLPEDQKDRAAILNGYRKMMNSLKKYQDSTGMWHQLVDDPGSWAESSCTGMFTYAIISGVKNGWLEAAEFGPVARSGWMALVNHLEKNGDIKDVCEGTNKKNDRQYYLDRRRVTGDLHGQAPLLWCAYALLETPEAAVHQPVSLAKPISVTSPDHRVVLSLGVEGGKLYYQASYRGRTVIEPSLMSLTVDGQETIAHHFGTASRSSVNTSYATRGVHSRALNWYNQLVLPVAGPGSDLVIEARVYNNGIAFRYKMSRTGKAEVDDEGTEFRIPVGSVVWSQDDIRSYEGKYNRQPIEEVKPGQLAGPPLTVKLPEGLGYEAITEGRLTDFAGMSLKSQGTRTFRANLSGITAQEGGITSPWRIVEIGGDLNTLVNCDIISNVSPAANKQFSPPTGTADWIRPGKSVWSWLATKHEVSFENMKHFSLLAGQLGIAYNLVDEGWSRWQEGDKDKWALLKELVNYSDSQGVKIWVWKAYPDRAGVPGLKDPIQRRVFFEKCKSLGIVGCKIDFFDAETQEVIDFYQAALKDAAELHLMLDFHGANKPTGESRTWPNEVSREGIRGLENRTDWPAHNTTLPFTRYLAGHGDYTPLSFREQLIKGTTPVHQMATMGVFTSPFLCLAADPEAIAASPAKDLIIHQPTVWDETRVLPQSEIGSLALFARRSGTTWYLFVLNGPEQREITVPLSFLGPGKYHSTQVKDSENAPEKMEVTGGECSTGSTITISLLQGGGFVGRFEPPAHRSE